MHYRDKDVLNSFAKIAVDEYLGRGQAPLNTTLKKIAADENLTPHQIEYIASEANRMTWAKLFAMDKKASYDFPLAESHAVIKDLQIKTQKNEIAEADLDYLSPPKSTKLASFDPLAEMGFVPENIEKSAGARKEIKRELQNRFEKISAAKEEIERLLYVTNTAAENLTEQFVKAARTMVLESPDSEKPATLDKIAEFVSACGEAKRGQDLMRKLSYVIERQGIMKKADLKAPEQYISNKTPARIINGNHSLYITIKTIFEKQDYASNLLNRHEIVDSSLPMIQEKIREL